MNNKEGSPSPKKLLEAKEERYRVKDSWLREYVAGNSTAPQSFLAIDIFLAVSVLQDLPDSWEDFLFSDLDEEQISGLGEIMTKLHVHHGVKVSSDNSAHLFPKDAKLFMVDRTRISKLWTDARGRLFHHILALVDSLEPTRGTEVTKALDGFFKNSSSKNKIQKILDQLLEMKKAFYSPDAQKWLSAHKAKLLGAPIQDKSFVHEDRAFRRIILATITNNGRKKPDQFSATILRAFDYI